MAVTYYAILTAVGAAKLANAAALGTTLQITQMAVGDGGGNVPVPDANRTTLVNEVRRAPLNQLKIDPSNSAQIIAEQVIPESVGGWWIREMGLLDNTGALIAIANCAPSYKPQLAEGSGRTQTVRMVLIVNNTGSVELKIDPSVVLATREYCDNAITTAINRQDAKASVRAATTANIALNGLPTVDGVVLAAGDRVLVKNQAAGSQNGIYVAAAGAWARSADADENAEVTPSLIVSVESGTAQADTVWQMITDAPIVVGTTALVFQDITYGLARLASPAFTGNPTAPTPAAGDNSQLIPTTAFVQGEISRASGRLIGTQVFTASGTYIPTSGMKFLIVEQVGGGGGSGGTSATGAGQASLGGGGAGGAYAKGRFTAAQVGASQPITIGTGGTAGPASSGSGGTGGTTSFGSLMSAPGGFGGVCGVIPTPPIFGSDAGIGSSAPSGANIVGFTGEPGDFGCLLTSTSGLSGSGGSSPFGTGGFSQFAASGLNGRPGTGYGSGAGGAANAASQAAKAGVAGQPGLLIVWEYA